jgi:hypothetical protein
MNIKDHAKKCQFLSTEYKKDCDCDGYHTFGELYDHRIVLWIALCRATKALGIECDHPRNVWRSKKHSDGEICFGTGTQFLLGIGNRKGEQITYHLPIKDWDECDFAETLEKAPEFDGHTSDDVMERLRKI